MSLSFEERFQFPEVAPSRAAGPMEKLWQSDSSFGTMFLSGSEVRRREMDALAQGRKETESRLRAEHESELASVRYQVTEALAAFDRERSRYFQQIEKDLVRLAMSIARKAVGHELKTDPALLLPLVRQVLRRLESDGQCCLRVARTEEPIWEKALAGTLDTRNIALLVDDSLPAGRYVLETPVGSTVLDPLSELDEIEDALMRTAAPQDPQPSATVQ